LSVCPHWFRGSLSPSLVCFLNLYSSTCFWDANTCYFDNIYASIGKLFVAILKCVSLFERDRRWEWFKSQPFLESPLKQQGPPVLPLFWFLISQFKCWIWFVRWPWSNWLLLVSFHTFQFVLQLSRKWGLTHRPGNLCFYRTIDWRLTMTTL
jgi:hypothetical protein